MPLMSRWDFWQEMTWHKNEERGVLEGQEPGALHLKERRKRDFSSLLLPHSNIQSYKDLSEATCVHQHRPISFLNSLVCLYFCVYLMGNASSYLQWFNAGLTKKRWLGVLAELCSSHCCPGRCCAKNPPGYFKLAGPQLSELQQCQPRTKV